MKAPFSTLTALLRRRSAHNPDFLAHTFVDGDAEQALTRAILDRETRRLASVLQEHQLAGERVILIYPVGPAFMTAFYACQYAGAVSVPSSEPHQQRVSQSDLERLLAIIGDCRPKAVMTTPAIRDAMRDQLDPHHHLIWLTKEELDQGDPELWRPVDVTEDHLSFLQYTSGSTGTPKGVMVSHRNLLANQEMLAERLGNNTESVIVSWLPLFHDMGLICKMLHATYLGVPSYHMSPSTFIRQPIAWLRALSQHGGTFSGGPNFAYELCVQRISEARKKDLDLSTWQVAMNGSEPVRHRTQARFAEAFAQCGFQAKAFNPCYGLAEATVFVSGYRGLSGHGVAQLDETALGDRRVVPAEHGVSIVGSGYPCINETIRIVHPDSRDALSTGQIGEIWVQGPHIAEGYWERPEQTEATFHARIAGRENEPGFLRTGDLGFIHEDELYFTGRLKEMIIVNGVNYYPQDIEQTVERVHDALRPHCGAAFSIEIDGAEKLVVVYEVLRKHRSMDFAPLFEALRQAIHEHHDLPVHALVIIQPKTMPKTTSGKLMRTACRARYLADDLQIVAQWRATVPNTEKPSETNIHDMLSGILADLAAVTGIPVENLSPATAFRDFGLDSVRASSLAGMLSERTGQEMSPTLMYDYPTPQKLAAHLSTGDETPTTDDQRDVSQEPIAIVGMACRFPGSADLDAYWSLLNHGQDAIDEVPEDRWNWREYYSPDEQVQGRMRTRWGGFLPQIDHFDAAFFGIAPREADQMDPQQRLLLEVTWEALENAGINPDRLEHSDTGVFIGTSNNDYQRFNAGDTEAQNGHAGTGNAASIAANRLSYILNLRGPSMAIDTACSSSLVAVHQACQAIWRGDSGTALAGGVNLILHPDMTLVLSHAGMMSPTGRCRTFDADADGYVRGEGCGMVILKPLSQAQADGDRIHALIRSGAVNQDGHSNGLTAPNGPAQEAVVREALSRAAVAPEAIDFVETHGSGTALGDPIEVGALKRVLCPTRDQDRSCSLGAVKTQIGHLEAAAGIAGLIKTALVLKHQRVPGNLHLANTNPLLDLGDGRLDLPGESRDKTMRLAGVSSFGFGGTNAHIIMERAPKPETAVETSQTPCLLPVSARTPAALRDQVSRYRDALTKAGTDWPAFCQSAALGRRSLDYRKAFVAADRDAAVTEMNRWLDADEPARAPSTKPPSPVFLFTGQGSQYAGMARSLYDSEPSFHKYLDEAAHLLDPHLERPLLEILFGEDETAIHQTGNAQPALFALEYALAQTWRSWGVEPAALMGHSVGEVVAAVLAGVFDLADGCRLIAARARLMQALPEGGGMTVCFAAEDRLKPFLANHEGLAFAAFNAPDQTVISGALTDLTNIEADLSAAHVKTRRLQVSHAFHAPLMEPMLDEFRAVVHTIRFQTPRIPIFSNLTGAMASDAMADPEYWVRHVREPVRFQQSLLAAADAGYEIFLEVGPKPSLTALARRILEGRDLLCLTSMRKGPSPRQTMLTSLGELYETSQPIQWRALYQEDLPRVDLPHYPWQRHRHWLPERTNTHTTGGGGHPWLGRQIAALAHLPGHAVFESQLDPKRLPFLKDHRVFGRTALPVAGFANLMTEAATALDHRSRRLEDLDIHQPLFLEEGHTRHIQIAVMPDVGDSWTVQILAHGETGWRRHATGRMVVPSTHDAADLEMGMMFFASSQDTGQVDRKYQLVIDTARFADEQGFSSLWVPERHFTNLGCLYPNPAVLQAALATATSRIRLQAGSVVLPIHHPMRVAEEWSMVDNLSGGRVGVSCASGWNPDDFSFFPDNYQKRHEILFQDLETLRALWRGESMKGVSGTGLEVDLRLQPEPIQKELPVWVTAAGNPKTFEKAGAMGANLLTHLLDQGVDALEEKIAIYRKARADHGFDPAEGMVTVMLHTFVGEEAEAVRAHVKPAYCNYLKHNIGLLRGLAHSRGSDVDITKLPEKDLDDFVGFLFDRFAAARGLIGSPESCLPLLEEMDRIGADEIACLLDIGPREDEIRSHLPHLNRLKTLYAQRRTGDVAPKIQANFALDAFKERAREFTGETFYQRFDRLPFTLEGSWQGVRRLWLTDDEALAQVALETDDPHMKPVLLEACTHALMAALSEQGAGLRLPELLPSAWERFEQWRPLPATVWSHAKVRHATDGKGALGDIEILDAQGEALARITGLTLSPIDLAPSQENKPSWFYGLNWEPLADAPVTEGSGDFLVFGDPGDPLITALREQLPSELGLRFVPHDMDPLNQDHFNDLWASNLDENDRPLKGIINLWPLTGVVPDLDVQQLVDSQIPMTGAGLNLLQTLATRRDGHLPPIYLVTQGAQSVLGDEPLHPEQATLWGMARVAGLEYPDLPLVLIDLDPEASAETCGGDLAKRILGEHTHNQLALRAGKTYGASLHHLGIEPGDSRIVAGKNYWITGGAGGLGLALAQWLIEQGATDLLLSGRSAPSDTAMARISAWREQGVHIELSRGDISRESHIRAVFARFGRELPELKGIFHLAGLPDTQMLFQQDWEHIKRVRAAKVEGSFLLHKHSRELELDHFVLFSSAAALLTLSGQSNYASASSYMDMLAHWRRRQGLPGLSINWGPWGDVGHATLDHMQKSYQRFDALGMQRIEPNEGMVIMGDLLACGHAQVGVIPVDWAAFFAHDLNLGSAPVLADLHARHGLPASAASEESAWTRELRTLSPRQRQTELEDGVRALVIQVLELIDAPEGHRGFFDMGMDSLMALDLRAKLQTKLGFPLPSTLVFEHSSVNTMASFLAAAFFESEPPEPEPTPTEPETDLTSITDLSGDELAAMIDRELETLLP